jgi:glycosyltransferase involved in cell wall biosynthesis
MSFDISVIIPAHHEGRLAHTTMRSLFRSVKYANERGVKTEIIIVMDKPDDKTLEYFSRYENSELLIKTVDFGDLGFTRNFGVNLSSGKYVTFLDGDNLYGQNWIYESVRYLEENNDIDIIVHPDYHIAFEAENGIWQQVSSNDSRKFNIKNLIEYNYWDAVCATKKQILLKYPYRATTGSKGFGFEDWHFNCETLAAGIEHLIIPGTVHFMRKKRTGSLATFTLQDNRIIRPTKLFEPAIFKFFVENN